MSINIGPFCYYQNSKVYEIPHGQSTILPGLLYSFVTIVFGWWGFRLRRPLETYRNSLEALHINFSGGEDISALVTELDHNEKTKYVWKNILRKTSEKLRIDEIGMIIEIHEEFTYLSKELYDDENIDYIILNLSKVDIDRVGKEDILDIFDALKNYELNENFA